MRGLRWAVGLAAAALLAACANPSSRRFPDPPPPRTAAVRTLAPLSAQGVKTCISWRDHLDAEGANLDLMDRQVSDLRQAIDDEDTRLTAERAAVDTRYLQQVKDYGRHVENNRKRVQLWNTQVDAYNARVIAYNQDMRTYQSGCGNRMPPGVPTVRALQANRGDPGAAGRAPTATP